MSLTPEIEHALLLARLLMAEARVKRLESAQGDWVRGLKCDKCAGTGENEDARTCSACAGTGDVWMTWQARAEAAEARVAMADRSIEELQAALNTQVDRMSWLEQQREEECKQKEAALKESGMCLKETREFKERAFKAEARVRELEELCDAEDKRMEACDWVRQYREACIKIADMHDELEAVKTQNARLREALCDALAVMPDGPMRDAVKAALADGKVAP